MQPRNAESEISSTVAGNTTFFNWVQSRKASIGIFKITVEPKSICFKEIIFSSITVFIYQGLITIGAGLLAGILGTEVITNMSSVGGVIILGLGLNMIGVTKIKIANLLPSIFLPILFQIFM